MTVDDTPTPKPDPGNSPPEDWSEDFPENDPNQLSIFGEINSIAVSLPEPVRESE